MTTFTMQDLNTRNINDLPTTQEEDEAMDALARLGAGVELKVPVIGISDGGRTVQYQHAPEPQPTLCESTQTLEQILKTIGEQFALLSTVINQVAKAVAINKQGESA